MIVQAWQYNRQQFVTKLPLVVSQLAAKEAEQNCSLHRRLLTALYSSSDTNLSFWILVM